VAAALLVGCTSRLLIETEPSGAIVTVSNEDGKAVRSGPSPLVASLPFKADDPATFEIEVQPSTQQAERYHGTRRTLNGSEYFALPEASSGGKRLSFTLEEKDYVNLPRVEVMLTPQGKWVGVTGTSRSYKVIGEAGGQVPALIVDLGENRGIAGMALSPEGDRIVYAEGLYDRRLDTPPPADPDEPPVVGPTSGVYQLKGANLRGINIAGGGVQHITTEDYQDLFPSFTPDGERLLFASNRRGELLGILGIRATGRSGISDIYVNHRNGILMRPSAARDGTIAFAVANLDPARGTVAGTQVWTNFGPDNPFPTQVTTDGGREPAISPDGSQIAYIHPRDGNLWVVNVDSSLNTQLTFGGTEIMKRYRGKLTAAEQAVLDADTATGRRMIAPYRDPSWTPDGQWILYSSMEGVAPDGRPNLDIWIIAADGSEKYQLTTNGSVDRYPLMDPEGGDLYFLSNRGESWGVWRLPFAAGR
jgi:Tol biopolymer transport system component